MKYTIKRKLRHRTMYVKGMTCNNCETRIENRISKIKGVTRVQAGYRRSRVRVVFDGNETNSKDIISAIEEMGYETVPGPLYGQRSGYGKKEGDGISLEKLVILGVIIYLIYRTLQNTGIDFLPQINQNMGYGILFVVGLLTSLHCIAMCGGINLSQCVNNESDKNGKGLAKLRPSLLYNVGRVISYTVMGGIVGGIGSVVSFSGSAKGIVALVAGAMMVLMGLNMLNVFPALRRFNLRMPKVLSRLNGENRKREPFLVGLLNGLMPCGPLQAMQLYALGTGSVFAGAISMFFFSMGTVPLMFGLGALSSILNGKFTRKIMKTSAALVIVLGIIMFNRGLGLSGISVFDPGTEASSIASVKGNIQTVTTNLESGRYTPITVQKGIPVKWTIQADEADLNGCNNPITIPKYRYTKELSSGDNVIEFIPEQEGNIVYTCWMGMIRSNITVVEDLNKV